MRRLSQTKRPSVLHRRLAALAVAAGLIACGGSAPTSPGGGSLPAQPEAVSPAAGTQLATDTPTFTVRNARGFDAGQATYTFRVATASGAREIATVTVSAGSGTTSATFAAPLPRGMTLTWVATASRPGSEVSSSPAQFRTVAVACLSGRDAYAKSVVDFFLPPCSLMNNRYNDPREVLGPPDAGQLASGEFFGFMSLGERGYVTVDMEGCTVDEPGPDVRVFQTVGMEPVTLYAAGTPSGPFQLLEARKPCGTRLPGVGSRYCDFDLASPEVQEARYFRIEDGEIFPCPGDTDSEGADIDAIQILHPKP